MKKQERKGKEHGMIKEERAYKTTSNTPSIKLQVNRESRGKKF